MIKSMRQLKKLKGRSFAELRVRGGQAVAARLERYAWLGRAQVPDDRALFNLLDAELIEMSMARAESLLEYFREREKPAFFDSFKDKEATLAELRRRWPQQEEAVIRQADKLASGYFDLLGLTNLYFGNPVDWHLEPVSGNRAPLAHWSNIEYDSSALGDKKIIWELNRHQYFATLGKAYWYTGDESYAEVFANHVERWIEANPHKLGINWASSLEIAFRAISWLWALYFFKDSARLTPSLFLRILKLLYLQAKHLETYLSTYFSPNTHLTGEALGLFYLGTILPKFREAARWRETGKRVLTRELHRHVKPDGVYFEQSSYYHRYTASFYTHFLILAKANGEIVDTAIADRLTSLLDHLMYITRPDGTTPFFGDDDGGRLMKLDDRAANDFRETLSTGAAFFARDDYKYVAGGAAEETLWLLGGDGLRAFDGLEARAPQETSRGFADGGYFVMRDGWARESSYLLMDCGPHGALNCGHAHSDALAFEFAAGGVNWLIDPGTFTYTADLTARNAFRSSQAHNTVTIDGESQSVPSGPFFWSHTAHSTLTQFITGDELDYCEGIHDGYARLSDPVTHRRSVLLVKPSARKAGAVEPPAYAIIRDRFEAQAQHLYELTFHFSPGLSVETAGSKVTAKHAGGPQLQVASFGRSMPEAAVTEGWVSECYGHRRPAPVVTMKAEGDGPQEFITFLIPSHGNLNVAVEQTSHPSSREWRFEIRRGDRLEVVALSTPDEMTRFESDSPSGSIAFARLDGVENTRD